MKPEAIAIIPATPGFYVFWVDIEEVTEITIVEMQSVIAWRIETHKRSVFDSRPGEACTVVFPITSEGDTGGSDIAILRPDGAVEWVGYGVYPSLKAFNQRHPIQKGEL